MKDLSFYRYMINKITLSFSYYQVNKFYHIIRNAPIFDPCSQKKDYFKFKIKFNE